MILKIITMPNLLVHAKSLILQRKRARMIILCHLVQYKGKVQSGLQYTNSNNNAMHTDTL